MPPALAFQLRRLRRMFAGLPKRAYLTMKYNGGREFWWRVLTFPLRLTPFGHRLGLAPRMSDPSAPARRWYREHARPVAVVIPSYGPADVVAGAVKSVRKTTDHGRVRVIVSDDGSAPEHQAALRALEGIDELVLGEEQRGFAANCNRGLRAARPEEDVVLLNSDVQCHTGWLEVLQHSAYTREGGVVGGKLLYPDGTIQFGGGIRNPYFPEWFEHRYRGRHADVVETDVPGATMAVTGACLYATRACLDDVGELDEGYEMAFEDIDLCLRAWEAGHRVLYAPAATLTHFESKTRGMTQGERELRSQARFWERWGTWFDRRDVTAEDGGLRVVYVTLDTGVGGGHRVIFHHLNGLAERGHHPELWTLADGPPEWFDLQVPVRTFDDFASLRDALAPLDAIKVATWWETADWVWEAALRRGVGVYLVQDIETSYYDAVNDHAKVMASYRPEWAYLAGSEWVADRLRGFSTDVTTFTPGIDADRFRPIEGVARRDDLVLALGRSNPLKDFPLTRDAYLALPEPRPELRLYGIEPELAEGLGPRVVYETRPSDERVVELLSEATVLLQTSKHEGFCLPALEGMAAGAAVVCTDANGNRDFCRDGENCLMPAPRADAVAEAVARALADRGLRDRMAAEGRRTAEAFAWPARLDELERWYRDLAAERSSGTRRAAPQRVA